MADELEISGKKYISSKKAAEMTDYAQDYIGQLARKGQIDAQRMGGSWYVDMASLKAYQAVSDDLKPKPVQKLHKEQAISTDVLVSFDGRDYISANRASRISGYSQDYVGQLARKGKIISRQVGKRWYVDRESLLKHKQEKDSLLAAVQAESVGIPPYKVLKGEKELAIEKPLEPLLTYETQAVESFPLRSEAEEKEEGNQSDIRVFASHPDGTIAQAASFEEAELLPVVISMHAQNTPASASAAPSPAVRPLAIQPKPALQSQRPLAAAPVRKPLASKLPPKRTVQKAYAPVLKPKNAFQRSIELVTIAIIVIGSLFDVYEYRFHASFMAGDKATANAKKTLFGETSSLFSTYLDPIENLFSKELVYTRS